MKIKNVLVCGGLGFAGFNFVQYLVNEHKDLHVVCLDNMINCEDFRTYKEEKIEWLEENEVPFYKYSIVDPKIACVIGLENIDTIVNFAEDNITALEDPILESASKLTTNTIGVYNLLELTKKYKLRFHNVGDTSVYSMSPDDTTPADETFRLEPNGIIGATKASADIIASAFAKTFKVFTTTSRVGFLFGPWQDIGAIRGGLSAAINEVFNGRKVGASNIKKQYTYVYDHSRAIYDILMRGKNSQTYDITSRVYDENLDINSYFISDKEIIDFVFDNVDRKSNCTTIETKPIREDFVRFVKGEKLRSECKFKNRKSTIADDMKETINWYLKNDKTMLLAEDEGQDDEETEK